MDVEFTVDRFSMLTAWSKGVGVQTEFYRAKVWDRTYTVIALSRNSAMEAFLKGVSMIAEL